MREKKEMNLQIAFEGNDYLIQIVEDISILLCEYQNKNLKAPENIYTLHHLQFYWESVGFTSVLHSLI